VLDDVASLTLQRAISGLSTRQQVTANNIANLETPGFIASSVDFESSLADAISAGNPTASSTSVSPTTLTPGLNGNNVDLATELTTATKTTLQEQLLSNALTSQYGLISMVLKG
jgi:flagellar basal-body rod protein FlgB